MSWNPNDNDPWGRKNSPPDLDDAIKQLRKMFFSGNARAREFFDELHNDLYDVAFWLNLQDKINQGYVLDVFPYRRAKSFRRGIDSQIEVFSD